MLEISLLALLATVGAGLLIKRRDHKHPIFSPFAHLKTITTVAKNGLFAWDKPMETTNPQPFTDLHLIEGGFSLVQRSDIWEWLFSDIQAQSAVSITTEGLAVIQLHVERDGLWRILTLTITQSEMSLLLALLRRYRQGLYHINTPEVWFHHARLAEQNWQGDITLGAEVWLLLVGRLLVILQEDKVKAKIDLSALRQVIALERKNHADGLVRLHSTTQIALFTMKNFEQFAQVLTQRSNSGLQVVTMEEKKEKG